MEQDQNMSIPTRGLCRNEHSMFLVSTRHDKPVKLVQKTTLSMGL